MKIIWRNLIKIVVKPEKSEADLRGHGLGSGLAAIWLYVHHSFPFSRVFFSTTPLFSYGKLRFVLVFSQFFEFPNSKKINRTKILDFLAVYSFQWKSNITGDTNTLTPTLSERIRDFVLFWLIFWEHFQPRSPQMSLTSMSGFAVKIWF